MIKLEVHSTQVVIRSQKPLTVGLRGAKAQFAFGASWAGLTKTAVFRQGKKTVAVADIAETVTIPWEVLQDAGVPMMIGVYGINETGEVAIPTLWAQTDPVRPGTDPEGDPSTEPTPGLWEQLQGKMGSLEQLNTEAKTSLAAAINEANRPVRVVTVAQAEDGVYVADHTVGQIAAMLEDEETVVCWWYDKNVMLHLATFQSGNNYAFTAIDEATEYTVAISQRGIVCSVTELAKAADLPTAVKVTLTEEDGGRYTANVYCSEILRLHEAGHTVYCQWKNMVLPLLVASKAFCSFGCVHGGNVYTVQIGLAAVTVTVDPMEASGAAESAVLYTPQELTAEQQAQARHNIGALAETDLSASGGSAFQFTKLIEDDVRVISIPFPVNWEKILQFNIHFDFGAKFASDLQSYIDIGSGARGFELLKAGVLALNVYGVHHWTYENRRRYFAIGTSTSTAEAGACIPSFPKINHHASPTGNHFDIWSETNGVVFPAGTKITVWGVYAP